MASEPKQVIVEPSSNSALTIIVALVVVALIGVAAYSLIESRNDKDSAIATAAHQVGDAAQKAGDAAKDAADGAKQ